MAQWIPANKDARTEQVQALKPGYKANGTLITLTNRGTKSVADAGKVYLMDVTIDFPNCERTPEYVLVAAANSLWIAIQGKMRNWAKDGGDWATLDGKVFKANNLGEHFPEPKKASALSDEEKLERLLAKMGKDKAMALLAELTKDEEEQDDNN